MMQRLAVVLVLAFTQASAFSLSNKEKQKLDINQIAYIEGQPVLGDAAGQGALNQCRAFADYMINNPMKPEVKVCGTGIKMTVYLLGRCGKGSLNSADLAHTWEIGACDTGMSPKTCEGFDPTIDPRMGAAQSYIIEQC